MHLLADAWQFQGRSGGTLPWQCQVMHFGRLPHGRLPNTFALNAAGGAAAWT
jgi:hypothetical protein